MQKRDLKFRIWNGIEMITDVTIGKFGTFYVNPSNNGLDPNDSASLTPFTTKYSDTTPVMQYTGFKDNEGTEIFEGDICKCWIDNDNDLEFFNLVIFQDGAFGYVDDNRIFHSFAEHSDVSKPIIKDWLVVGNYYKNPELFKRVLGV